MALRIVQVCVYLWLMPIIMTTLFGGTTKATGVKQNDPGKLKGCSAMAFSSTAVLLTWHSPSKDNGLQNKRNFSIHYWPLYSKDNVTVLHVGEVSHKLIENLDIITYYGFRIVARDHSGRQHQCTVLAKTFRDARFHLPLNSKRLSGGGIKESWNAVTLQGNQVFYRLFMEWRHRGQVNVRLLCETNLTSCVVKGKLPLPHRVYVSVVFVKEVHKFLAGNIRSYPTKKVVISDIDDLPTKPAHADNKTHILSIVAHRIGWKFVILSWNAITAVGGHATYRVTSKGRNDIIDKVTSNTSVLLSGLDQLTRYKIKVQAQEKNGGSLLASAVVVLNTLDKNECLEMSGVCSDNSECINTRGSYFCRCLPGWAGDGKICKGSLGL